MINTETLSALQLFRIKLLRLVVLTTSLVSFGVLILSLVGFLILDTYSQWVLGIFSIINMVSFFILRYNQEYYLLLANISTLSSLLVFIFLTFTVVHDEFRMVWFFFTTFASFIFGGKRYGVIITVTIIAIVIPIFLLYDINLSKQALFTFINSLVIFSVFIYLFLDKIDNDEKTLHSRIEEEVEKRHTQEMILLRQYRMTNMGEMIDAIAHQWRQPLNQANFMMMEMEERLGDEAYLMQNLSELLQLTAHMSQTIDDFRQLLHEDKEKQDFFLDEVIEEVLSLLKNNLKEVKVLRELTHSKSRLKILGYKNELIQVFIILISNTLEAFERRKITSKVLRIALKEEEKRFILAISDNAGGINEAIIDKIFDPYFSTKKGHNGTGLGLYIAKIIIQENMEEEIKVTNKNQGVLFEITLMKEEKDVELDRKIKKFK